MEIEEFIAHSPFEQEKKELEELTRPIKELEAKLLQAKTTDEESEIRKNIEAYYAMDDNRKRIEDLKQKIIS